MDPGFMAFCVFRNFFSFSFSLSFSFSFSFSLSFSFSFSFFFFFFFLPTMGDYDNDIVITEGGQEIGGGGEGGEGGEKTFKEENYGDFSVGMGEEGEEVAISPESLQFQDYSHTTTSMPPPTDTQLPLPSGSMIATADSLGFDPSTNPFPPPSSSSFPLPPPPSKNSKKKKKKKKKKTKSSEASWYQLEYYQNFFDFDTNEITLRLKTGVNPLTHSLFHDMSKERPDLYVSVWATATLWFLLVLCGDMASALAGNDCSVSVEFDLVGYGFMATYGYVTFFPFVIYLLLKFWVGVSDHHLAVGLCWYGYSLLPYFPSMIFGIFPYAPLRWIPFGLSCILSSYFLFLNYFQEVEDKIKGGGGVILGIIVLADVGLCILYKMVFFDEC